MLVSKLMHGSYRYYLYIYMYMQLDVQQFGAHVLEPLAGARMQPLRGVGSPYICTAVLTSGL